MIDRCALACVSVLVAVGAWVPCPAAADASVPQGDQRAAAHHLELTDLAARRQTRGKPWSKAEHSVWANKVATRVRERWSRAALSGDRSLDGRVVVRFTVMANGQVAAVALVEASGNATVDRLAVEAMRQLGRLPPPATGRPENVVVPLRVIGRGREA